MPVPSLSAARAICELRDWKVSNLELQKILYIAHMIHLGETEQPLVPDTFEAWEYGPVLPVVYAKARGFGSSPVRNVFHWTPDVPPGSERSAIERACEWTKGLSPGRLVAITHSPQGAWHRCYERGVTRIPIPDRMILDEYRARTAA